MSLTARTKQHDAAIRRSRARIARYRKEIDKTRLSTRLFSGAMRSFGMLVGGAALLGGLMRIHRALEDFERAMNQSIAIMGDVDRAMRHTMERTAIDVARTTVYSAAEVAKAYYYLASAGLSATQSVAALAQVTQFAQAGMFDLALATDLLTDAQSALGLKSASSYDNMRNMARVADVLVKANTLANASVQQFSEALTHKAGPALKFLSKDIEEGVAVLAAFADQGIKASDAGTALNIILRDLSTKAIKHSREFRGSNIAVYDLADNMRNLADIVGDLERRLEGLGDKQKKATLLQLGFSDKSVVFMQSLIGTSAAVREYEAALQSATGTTADVASKQMTSIQRAHASFGAAVQDTGSIVKAAGFVYASAVQGLAMFGQVWSDTVRLMTTGTLLTKTMKELDAEVGEWVKEPPTAEQTARWARRLKELQGVTGGPIQDKRAMAARSAIYRQERLEAEQRIRLQQKEQRGLESFAATIRNRVLTPLEQFRKAMTRLNDAFFRAKPLLTGTEYDRYAAMLEKRLADAQALEKQLTKGEERGIGPQQLARFLEIDVKRVVVEGLRPQRQQEQRVTDPKAQAQRERMTHLLERIESKPSGGDGVARAA